MSKATQGFDLGLGGSDENNDNDNSSNEPSIQEDESKENTNVTSEEGDYEISDNVAEDVIEYSRGSVITNESQSYLTLLCWLSGWFEETENYTNAVVIGSSSGGKSHLSNNMSELLPDNTYYTATTGSSKSFIDDDSWNEKKCAVLSEFQKLPEEMVEFVKSIDGGDDGFEYARSVPDDSEHAEAGDRKTKKIVKKALPHSFTYAQFDMDSELWNRLLKIYISEGEVVNRAVAKMHSGHENITVDEEVGGMLGSSGQQREYIYDTSNVERALKRHHRSLPEDGRVFLPEYMYYSYSPCLDLKRSESKRTSKMFANLIRTSALQNYHSRPTIEVTEDGRTVEKIVASPQDLCNILSCREVLLGTTHEFETRQQALVQAVRANTELSDWCSLNDIQGWISANATQISKMKKPQLRDLLDDLADEFVIEISERHFDNGAHAYQFNSLTDIGTPKLTGFNESRIEYESDNPLMGVDDPDDPFKDCRDPFKDVPFKESVEEFRNSLRQSVSSSASSAMGSQNDDSGDEDSPQQHTLGGESASSEDDQTTLEDDRTIAVYDRLIEHADGCRFEQGVAHEDTLGLTDEDGGLDSEDTIIDPEHPCHSVYDDGSTDVTSVSEANGKVEEAFTELIERGVVEIIGEGEDMIRVEVSDVEIEVEE